MGTKSRDAEPFADRQSDAPAGRGAPLVSVCVITYNHARFLGDALAGVVAQRVDFEVEIVVADDGSSDGAFAVAEMYAARDSRVRLLESGINRGMHGNLRRALEACRGEYVALLEGDDYWTDRDKLSEQVRLMQSDAACSVCGHDVAVVDGAGKQLAARSVSPCLPAVFSLAELITCETTLPTGSLVFRAAAICYPSWVDELMMADSPLLLLTLTRGHGRWFTKVMGAYRRHPDSVTAGATPMLVRLSADHLRMYDQLAHDLGGSYHGAFADARRRLMRRLRAQISEAAARCGAVAEVEAGAREALGLWPGGLRLPWRYRRQVVADSMEMYLYRRYGEGWWRESTAAWRRMLWLRPSAVLRRGFWVIGARSAAGTFRAGLSA
jgi:glycosyltransferase involved in cell wall biosynthesis